MQHACILENDIESLTTSKYLTACSIPFVKAFQGLSSTELWIRSKSQCRRSNTVIPYTSPCILYILYIYAHIYAYVHRKSQGSTGRNCNMVIRGGPKPCKNTMFLYPSPCILHFGKRARASEIGGINRSNSFRVSRSFLEFPKKMKSFETHRAKHIISYHRFHIVLQSSTFSMSSCLHIWI
jgi:hypothetical protein